MLDTSTAPTISPSADTNGLLVHLRDDLYNDNIEFFNLCLFVARAIDYAVANNEIPGKAPDLPYLLKQVCQRKNDVQLQAAIMVLMISIQNACINGWFSEKENQELNVLSDEIRSIFCSVRHMNSNMNSEEIMLIVSTIMSRFYPGMKMGEILASVEALPGYDSYVEIFYISKNSKSSPNDGICLFVAQIDNIETSSCIVGPEQVNFLLNGIAVDKRNGVHRDPGPQMPTPITHMLKYGPNLLQAVGQFNEKYIIVAAFMSMVSNPSRPAIPDYVPPAGAASNSDNEIIEGPSTISLNCPISFRRVKTPVKGHLCKHLQCFDFDNYVEINSRRPSWRCPLCSQSVCFSDIRIDKSMVKVLKEVGANVSHVKIFADGSWEAVTENDDQKDKSHGKAPLHQESTIIQNTDVEILDLTGDDEVETSDPHQDNDRKPSSAELRFQPNVTNAAPGSLDMNNVHRNTAMYIEDRFWRDLYLSTYGAGTSNTRSNATELQHVSNAVPYALTRVTQGFQRSNLTSNSISHGQSPNLASNVMQSQGYDNSGNNGYGRYLTPDSYITRTPILAQTSAGVNGGTQQEFSRFQQNPHQVLPMTLAPPSEHLNSWNWGPQGHSLVSSQPSQQLGAHSAFPQQSGSHYTSALPADRFTSHQQQSPNQMTLLPVWSSAQPSPQIRLGGAQGGVRPMTGLGSSQPYYTMAGAQQATRIRSRSPSIPAPVQTPGPFAPVTARAEQRGQGLRILESSMDASAGPSWRPTGRMLGSLSGRSYKDTLNQFPNLPAQPVQAARPPSVSLSGRSYQDTLNQFPNLPAQPVQAAKPPSVSLSGRSYQGTLNRFPNLPAQPVQATRPPSVSLSGRSYQDTLNRFPNLPAQPVQAARPPSVLNTPRPFLPPHLQVLLANHINAHASEGGGTSPVSESSLAGGGGGGGGAGALLDQ